MSNSEMSQKPKPQMLAEILEYVESSGGLSSNVTDSGVISIHQAIDGKIFRFTDSQLSDVLQRTDSEGKPFIQVNFQSGSKVLFTDTLVGFKPKETTGLDMTKIPRVVTTPDLLSVFEAIEESMSSDNSPENEVEILKKVFQAILLGGETAGFDLGFERRWLASLTASHLKASA